jgi:hypothetical protein
MTNWFIDIWQYYKEGLREFTLDCLFKMIGYLSGHSLVHVETDTAELVNDRRGLKINFVFGGQVREITLPYNPYQIDYKEYVVYLEGEELPKANLISTIPGLDSFLFSKEVLSKIYGHPVTKVMDITDE